MVGGSVGGHSSGAVGRWCGFCAPHDEEVSGSTINVLGWEEGGAAANGWGRKQSLSLDNKLRRCGRGQTRGRGCGRGRNGIRSGIIVRVRVRRGFGKRLEGWWGKDCCESGFVEAKVWPFGSGVC